MFIDGATNQKGLGVGIVIISSKSITIEKSLRLSFLGTNNEAECKTLKAGLNAIKNLGYGFVKVFCDLRLVVRQVQGEFVAKYHKIHWYLSQIKQLQYHFEAFSEEQIPEVRILKLTCWQPWLGESLPRIIMVENLATPYDNQVPVGINVVHVGQSWMDLMVTFIKNRMLPENRIEAEKVQRKSPRYWLLEEKKII